MWCLEETQITSFIRNTKFGLLSQTKDIGESQLNNKYYILHISGNIFVNNGFVKIFLYILRDIVLLPIYYIHT